jgi:hypothetical protein
MIKICKLFCLLKIKQVNGMEEGKNEGEEL